MKWVVAGLAGAALLACDKRDDTTFPSSPVSETSPARTVVDAGLVIFSDGASGSGPLGGGAGSVVPDAEEPPDVVFDVATSDAGGIGTPCDVFATRTSTPPTPCLSNLQCRPNLDGTGSCQPFGSSYVGGPCDTTAGLFCGERLLCISNTCIELCRVGESVAKYCSTGTKCVPLGAGQSGTGVGQCE